MARSYKCDGWCGKLYEGECTSASGVRKVVKTPAAVLEVSVSMRLEGVSYGDLCPECRKRAFLEFGYAMGWLRRETSMAVTDTSTDVLGRNWPTHFRITLPSPGKRGYRCSTCGQFADKYHTHGV